MKMSAERGRVQILSNIMVRDVVVDERKCELLVDIRFDGFCNWESRG